MEKVKKARRTKKEIEDDLKNHLTSIARLRTTNVNIDDEIFKHRRHVQWLLMLAARAKARKLPFNLTLDNPPLPETCPVLGIPLKFNSVGWNFDSYTMDRVDNTKGYTTDNVVIMSHKANMMKSSGTLADCVALGRWAESQLNSLDKSDNI